MARFLVGIDLGTTHTVIAFADLQAAAPPGAATQLFQVEQLVAPGEVAARPLLPSLRYHPAEGEIPERDMRLPWPDPDLGRPLPRAIIGELARELGSRVPGRLVTSAKSWLSHRSVDRTEPILPWGASEDVRRISPLLASASYIAHARAAWNHRFPGDPLQGQEIVLTVPASFDEGARALTVQAAAIAGLARVRLVEEPQAACYDWLARHHDRLGHELGETRLLLVCDVGGGTTDFTLIKVAPDKDRVRPDLARIGVGDHLMLGGDNMDLALAHIAEGRLVKGAARLTTAALSQLIQQCRSAKERLLSPDAPESASVTVLGTGAKLVAGARSTELGWKEVQELLVEGFFPRTGPNDFPQRVRGGIVEFGLPYAADPAVTRHLAAFLARHVHVAGEALGAPSSDNAVPDALLLNGGVFRSAVLSQRLLEVLASWRGSAVRQLDNDSPELAVARGAVAYGLARLGRGVRIGGGSARSYFLTLGSENEGRAVCILPRGTAEGNEMLLRDRTFSLTVGQPVRFHLVSSTGDASHRPGELVELGREYTHLPPIATVLREGEFQTGEIPVQISTVWTEVGTIEMNCIALDDPGRRWNLQFQLRGGAKAGAVLSAERHPRFGEALARIERIYGSRARDVEQREVRNLRRDLESVLGDRERWDTPLLRDLFSALWEGVRHRRRSADHERLWFNLAGYCLRPGFGYPLDDWRLQQIWTLHDQGVQYLKDARAWSEWWTLWRRVAGGLDAQAQQSLLEDLSFDLTPPSRRGARPRGPQRQGYDDMVRLAGSLERIHVQAKEEVTGWLFERLRKPSESSETWWAVGRIGARVPFYGSSHQVVPPGTAAEWLQQLLRVDWTAVAPASLAATLIARRSGDRERDLEPELRGQVAARLRVANAPPTWIRMVEEVAELEEADEQRIFGESLPPGLRLIH